MVDEDEAAYDGEEADADGEGNLPGDIGRGVARGVFAFHHRCGYAGEVEEVVCVVFQRVDYAKEAEESCAVVGQS